MMLPTRHKILWRQFLQPRRSPLASKSQLHASPSCQRTGLVVRSLHLGPPFASPCPPGAFQSSTKFSRLSRFQLQPSPSSNITYRKQKRSPVQVRGLSSFASAGVHATAGSSLSLAQTAAGHLAHGPSPTLAAITLTLSTLSVTAALYVGMVAFFTRVLGRKPKGSVPRVVTGDSQLATDLLSQLPDLTTPYRPYPGLGNRHVETIYAAFFRKRPPVRFWRELLRMADGGTVALDWPEGGADAEQWEELPPRAPHLILLPGLTGGSDDGYVRHLLVRARKAGFGVVVFNSRGCADSPVTSPQFYSASFTEDLRQVVRRVGELKPGSRLYAAGWSLGANILVRYLGQEGSAAPLAGAASLCNPFDLVLSDQLFHVGFNNIYDKALARQLRKIYAKHEALFENIGGEYNLPMAKKCQSVRQFDEGLTRVSFGYKTVDDYYYDASSCRTIKNVQVPLLCIQAEDDPIAPISGTPFADIEANPNCLLVVTPFGGHLGWVAGPEAPRGAPWTDPYILAFFQALEAMSPTTASQDPELRRPTPGPPPEADLVTVQERAAPP